MARARGASRTRVRLIELVVGAIKICVRNDAARIRRGLFSLLGRVVPERERVPERIDEPLWHNAEFHIALSELRYPRVNYAPPEELTQRTAESPAYPQTGDCLVLSGRTHYKRRPPG